MVSKTKTYSNVGNDVRIGMYKLYEMNAADDLDG